MVSQKTVLVEYLFHELQKRGERVVTLTDLKKAMEHANLNLGGNYDVAKNQFNFMKDLLRGGRTNENWPSSLTQLGITGRQRMGKHNGDSCIMEFMDFAPGQIVPFPNPFEADSTVDTMELQTISIPLTTKSFAHDSESWLVQVAANLRVVEQHLALKSPLRWHELVHLQVAVKLGGKSEIDALYLGVVEHDGELRNVLVTCEAKREKDPILGDQIVAQVRAAYAAISRLDYEVAFVVPVAIKTINKGALYVVEFAAWSATEASDPNFNVLSMSSRGVYQLVPPVPGVGVKVRQKNRRRAPLSTP